MAKKTYRLVKNSKSKVTKIKRQQADDDTQVLTLVHDANFADNSHLKPMIATVDDDEDGGDSGTGEFKPGELIGAPREGSAEMAVEQRLQEQTGHRHWAKVNVRERQEYSGDPGPGLKQHPAAIFQSQRFDGIDNSLNPVFPPMDLIAEFEQARKEQELQKQLRNQNELAQSYQSSSSPTFTR